MTNENIFAAINKHRELIEAFHEGKTIQKRFCGSNVGWFDVSTKDSLMDILDHFAMKMGGSSLGQQPFDLRVKPVRKELYFNVYGDTCGTIRFGRGFKTKEESCESAPSCACNEKQIGLVKGFFEDGKLVNIKVV